jgi:hypothetical protein
MYSGGRGEGSDLAMAYRKSSAARRKTRAAWTAPVEGPPDGANVAEDDPPLLQGRKILYPPMYRFLLRLPVTSPPRNDASQHFLRSRSAAPDFHLGAIPIHSGRCSRAKPLSQFLDLLGLNDYFSIGGHFFERRGR